MLESYQKLTRWGPVNGLVSKGSHYLSLILNSLKGGRRELISIGYSHLHIHASSYK